MAKKISGYIKLQLPAGKATPQPPVGPALGQYGVSIPNFTKEFNERTKNDAGLIIPVVITVYADRSFTFILKTPPAPVLIKKACGIESAFAAPNKNKVAKITKAQVEEIAKIIKEKDNPVNAMIEEINTSIAMKVPGIEAIYTYKDVPQNRFTMAGQTYPEPSPYDRLILDKHVRFNGDVVAIVAGETVKAVDRALKLIKVKYNVLPAVNDFRTAMDNPVLVHPEDNWLANCPVGADNKRNLCAQADDGPGDFMNRVDVVLGQLRNVLCLVSDAFHIRDHLQNGRNQAQILCHRLLLQKKLHAEAFNFIFLSVNLTVKFDDLFCQFHILCQTCHHRLFDGLFNHTAHFNQLFI